MKIGEKLQALIAAKGTNANELAQRANVPTSTMYSIIKRNNTKADIDVLIRIANILGVPVEYFGEEQSVWSDATATTAKAMEFSEREILLIKKYRQLDADGREEIDDLIDVKLAKLQRKAEEAMTAEEKEEALG